MDGEFSFKAGDTIPGHDWIVVAPIGAGGMGEIYEVRGALIDRRYVLKTLRRELRDDPGAVKRFLGEVRVLGSMRHANVVDIIATGTTTDEHRQPFFVMEKVYGSTLDVLLEVTGKLDVAYACDVFARIADALHAVHRREIIHRDVKPENIMLAPHGEAGVEAVKLLDFGIARRLQPSATGDLAAGMCTPRYTSPEQVQGHALTPATDIYALAVILYEAVTRANPWPSAKDELSYIAAHLYTAPAPLESHGEFPKRL